MTKFIYATVLKISLWIWQYTPVLCDLKHLPWQKTWISIDNHISSCFISKVQLEDVLCEVCSYPSYVFMLEFWWMCINIDELWFPNLENLMKQLLLDIFDPFWIPKWIRMLGMYVRTTNFWHLHTTFKHWDNFYYCRYNFWTLKSSFLWVILRIGSWTWRFVVLFMYCLLFFVIWMLV